jgi:AraC-like DNA-binding protein
MKSKTKNITTKDKIGLSELFKLKKMKPYIKPTKPHKHLGYDEIILLFAGEGFHTIEFNSYNIVPPVIFTLKPSQVHHWEFTEKPEGYVLMFKPEFLQQFQIINTGNLGIDECIQLNDKSRPIFNALFKAITNELEENKENYKKSISSYLNILLIELERLSIKHNHALTNSKFQLFNEFIKQHFLKEKKVNKYAEMLNISSKHLNDLCKTSSGKTASSIIQNYVNTEAKRLLIYTDKNISQITFELGFDNSSHFAKFFKTQVGTSPTLFRKNRFQ